jgi:hypothetical protein
MSINTPGNIGSAVMDKIYGLFGADRTGMPKRPIEILADMRNKFRGLLPSRRAEK